MALLQDSLSGCGKTRVKHAFLPARYLLPLAFSCTFPNFKGCKCAPQRLYSKWSLGQKPPYTMLCPEKNFTFSDPKETTLWIFFRPLSIALYANKSHVTTSTESSYSSVILVINTWVCVRSCSADVSKMKEQKKELAWRGGREYPCHISEISLQVSSQLSGWAELYHHFCMFPGLICSLPL